MFKDIVMCERSQKQKNINNMNSLNWNLRKMDCSDRKMSEPAGARAGEAADVGRKFQNKENILQLDSVKVTGLHMVG